MARLCAYLLEAGLGGGAHWLGGLLTRPIFQDTVKAATLHLKVPPMPEPHLWALDPGTRGLNPSLALAALQYPGH